MTTQITQVSGIGPSAAELLAKHGFKSAEDLANATVEQISAVPGFGAARAATVKQAATTAASGEGAPAAGKATVKKAPAKKKVVARRGVQVDAPAGAQASKDTKVEKPKGKGGEKGSKKSKKDEKAKKGGKNKKKSKKDGKAKKGKKK